MTEQELKNYLVQACNFLNISVEQLSENDFNLSIPDDLTEYFNNADKFAVTFNKNNNDSDKTYITNEAFLIQKIAKLVADRGHGITTGEIILKNNITVSDIESLFRDCKVDNLEIEQVPNDYLLVCIKITMRLNKIEEFLHCYKYNIATKECIEIPIPDEEYIQKISTRAFTEYNKDEILSYYDNILPYIKQTSQNHFEEKQAEYAKMCADEINRINEYYDILLRENSLPEATDESSAYESLNSERTNLINEQNKKFQISDNNIVVEPISICIIRENAEKSNIDISNKFGNTKLSISDKNEISCFYTNVQVPPFTITSDNHICCASDTFICSDCGKKYYINRKKHCKICHSEICEDCAVTSAISHETICKEHYQYCGNCGTLVAKDEVFKCEKCGKSFCFACNHSQHCQTCNSVICDNCKNISATSNKIYCQEHSVHCPTCNAVVGINELHTCSNCGISYCSNCNPNNTCKLCSGLVSINKHNPNIERLITDFNLKAGSYEFSKMGKIAIIVGKKLFVKTFLVVIDLEEYKIINRIDYNLFGKKIYKKDIKK